MKKLVTIILAVSLALSLLVGCAQPAEPDLAASTSKPPATSAATQASTATSAPPAEPEPVTYDYAKLTWYWYQGGRLFPEGIYPLAKMLEEINVELIPINPEGTDFENMLLTLIASGETPDVISTYTELTTKLISENVIIPVGDYLNEEHLPNFLRISNNWDLVVNTITYPDGKIWVVPDCLNNTLPDQADWVRQDWLDQVGVEIPKTYDDVEAMLLAFADKDLNGDGVKAHPMMANMLWGLAYWFEAYAADNRWYKSDDDGLPELGLLTPRSKDVLKTLKGLIDNNVISPDFQSTDYDQVTEMIRTGLVGYHHGYTGFDHGDDMKKVYADAEWVPFLPPTGIFDKGYANSYRRTNFTRTQYAVSSTCRDLDAVWRMIDWLCVDTATSTEAGNMTFEGSYWYQAGERGVNWDVINGKYVAGGTFPDDQALADKFQAQNEIDRWADWAFRRFSNKFDTRWMGTSPNALKQAEFRKTIPSGNDIPADHRYLARSWITPISDPAYEAFMNTYALFDNSTKLAEVYMYNALLGKKDIDALYEEYLALCNENGYQEVRQLLADHMAAYPFEY